ncbi:cytochrome c [bacterium]|nr:MAG: cytochrome c [bacterium]
MGGGPGGGPGGGLVDAKATAPDIFQMKCAGCHGDKGQGRMGPNLTKKAGAPDDALYKVIHDGAGKMPAFGSQMTEAQVKELVTYVKGLGKA